HVGVPLRSCGDLSRQLQQPVVCLRKLSKPPCNVQAGALPHLLFRATELEELVEPEVGLAHALIQFHRLPPPHPPTRKSLIPPSFPAFHAPRQYDFALAIQ